MVALGLKNQPRFPNCMEAQAVAQVLARATLWVRETGGAMLRITGDVEVLLARHVDEAVEVSIINKDEQHILAFGGVLRRYTSNGHSYIVVTIPKRLRPMLPMIEKAKDNEGKLWLTIKLLGAKKPTRRVEVKEEGRRGDG